MLLNQREGEKCPLCKKEINLFKINEAADFLRVSKKTIYGWIEEGKIYAIKTPGNLYRVCRGCLIKPCDR
ncbi:MAG: helix-turn-helix domain-containing protein [Acidobacteriota bacterium]